MTRLIALCSPAMGSGKSTVAQWLRKNHGFYQVTFAAPLKQMALTMLEQVGLSKQDAHQRVYGDRKEEIIPVIGVTSRELQQKLGTEFGRHQIRDSIWVDIAMARVNRLRAEGKSVVIDDMRFPNEYDAVVNVGGEPVRITRPDAVVTRGHVSEGQLDGYLMQHIPNNGTIEKLRGEVDALLLRL